MHILRRNKITCADTGKMFNKQAIVYLVTNKKSPMQFASEISDIHNARLLAFALYVFVYALGAGLACAHCKDDSCSAGNGVAAGEHALA